MGELTIEPTRSTAYGYGAFILWVLAWISGFVAQYLQVRFLVTHLVFVAYSPLLSACYCICLTTMFLVNRSTLDHMQW